ncbi:hypothetical protein FisN_17Hh137 [Fistulifera solaris]|uniref:Uncharacterized protein n=1 Tax=Fistulifera solaris TaxID=1519565 RepID=A0A1Z5JGS6_FISSO|nr:hypothetical protein FisN_17Hh137 [Fistulifera solaris]|eukprot:GAX13205.1 hypothetical protein FisN_17Hh137 [Fistulifera solaris]
MKITCIAIHLLFISAVEAFVATPRTSSVTRIYSSVDDDNNNLSEAERMKQKAQELREQIRSMEEKLGADRRRNYDSLQTETTNANEPTLRKKRVLVAGANGRLGSMVCRYLLRTHPDTEVVAAVHVIGENSPTSRGYGRLSYEVGAEDGIGRIGAAWSSEDRTATFEYDPQGMEGYNLQNLRLVECELLDPVQCQTVVEGCDAVIWCATDFNGNAPRAVASLNFAFLFRAVSRPAKGRVEVEGLENMLGALKVARQDAERKRRLIGDSSQNNDPINFVHVSMAPGTYSDFETPFGSFWGIKSSGEKIIREDFPSLTSTILQLCEYDDTFVEENLELQYKDVTSNPSEVDEKNRRRINRRDAARAAVDALLNKDLIGKTVQVWTDSKELW